VLFLSVESLVFKWAVKRSCGKVMYVGEFESLKAINETCTVRVPKPVKILESAGESIFVMECLPIKSLSRFQGKLGEELARLHLHNRGLLQENARSEGKIGNLEKGVDEFGFHVSTCCGLLPQSNTWSKSWPEFFARDKLQYQIELLQKEYGDRELESLWSELQQRLDVFFVDLEIAPSLLHGDLWSGNAAETESEPVIYDAAAFYGHDEYDLAIAGMFAGFSSQFYNAYHKLIPKAKGFEQRHILYTLFHYLNHWNHFGAGYRSQSISHLKSLLRFAKKS